MRNGWLLVHCSSLLAALLIGFASADEPAEAAAAANADIAEAALPRDLPPFNEVFGSAPLPTGDALWDRYSSEVFLRAQHPPEDLQGWHPALLDEETLISWADLGADPRYWELYHYCLYGQAEYNYFELSLQDAYLEGAQAELQSKRELAYMKREAAPAAPPWLAPYEALVEQTPEPEIAELVGASLTPLKILRQRGEASLTAELRWQEIESTLSAVSHAEWVLQDAIGRWPRPDRRSGVRLPAARAGKAWTPQALDAISQAQPQLAWPSYARAQFLALQGDEAGALAQLRAGNAAGVYELPFLFPLSAVAGRTAAFSDPGNLAVAGLVLDSGCTETPPAVLFEDWGLNAYAQSVVLSGDSTAMQDLHVYGLRLAATRRSDPRFMFSAGNLLSDLARAWLENAPQLDEERRRLLELEAELFADVPQILFDYTPGETVMDYHRSSMPAGYVAYYLQMPSGAAESIWPLRLGDWDGPEDAAWYNAVFGPGQFFNYLPRWASLQYRGVVREYPAPPREGEVPVEPTPLPDHQTVVTRWALNGLALDYAQQLGAEYTAVMLAELARLDYRQLPPRESWPLKGETQD
ncbi:hypothetical protein IT575_15370 [bacterium]|nr:hypothetical protein [bacterium]